MIYVVVDGDDSPELAFEDEALAKRWVTALDNGARVWAFDITTGEPDKRTWYACRAVVRNSVHIPTGERTSEVRRQIFSEERWAHQGRDGHTFLAPAEAEAHADVCDMCGTP